MRDDAGEAPSLAATELTKNPKRVIRKGILLGDVGEALGSLALIIRYG